eukprot:4682500-Amphidinium_carterae.1
MTENHKEKIRSVLLCSSIWSLWLLAIFPNLRAKSCTATEEAAPTTSSSSSSTGAMAAELPMMRCKSNKPLSSASQFGLSRTTLE